MDVELEILKDTTENYSFSMLNKTVRFIVWIISIPDEELFSETAVGCTASYFVKIIWCSRWFCKPPPPILRLCIALFAVAEGWLLLDIGWFVLFLEWQSTSTYDKRDDLNFPIRIFSSLNNNHRMNDHL